MGKESNLTAERVRELLDYDPSTGEFRWRVSRGCGGGARAGDIAGSNDGTGGYWRIEIEQAAHYAHRLAWLYVYGEWPARFLDHRNEDKLDNRIANLRNATRAQNRQNITRPYRSNTSGYTGVRRFHHQWQAAISVDGKKYHLGTFNTAEEGHAAYLAAKRDLHPFWADRYGVRNLVSQDTTANDSAVCPLAPTITDVSP